ncbi:hypothetical protein ACFL4U_03810 [Candidatus Neomarinimicrobiota bacterium]
MEQFTGIDPLAYHTTDGHDLLESQKKRGIANILKSYTGYFDVFSELIQNALDACEQRFQNSANGYTPIIKIDINVATQEVTVSDNGVGMPRTTFEYCLAPHFSFKRGLDLRGNKGVGATYLAYGFDSIAVHTKTDEFEASVILEHGRAWVEDESGSTPVPTFRDVDSPNDFLEDEDSGSVFDVIIGNNKPALEYVQAITAKQWYDLLRIRSSLGCIQLTGETTFKPEIKIGVIDTEGNLDTQVYHGAEYYYPHHMDIPDFTAQDISNIEHALGQITGSPEEKWKSLSDDYKNLNAVYHIWDSNEILSDGVYGLAERLDAVDKGLIETHDVSIYGGFLNKVGILDYFNDNVLRIRRSYRALAGGVQMASDRMPQGELFDVPLKRYIGYQQHLQIIVHFEDGDPDLGRKTFQPEKVSLAKKLAEECANILILYRKYNQVDDTAIPLASNLARNQWIDEQMNHLANDPLIMSDAYKSVTVLTIPTKEQDVIALFHQLIGSGVLRTYDVIATDQHKQYDSIIEVNFDGDEIFYSPDNKLGISRSLFQAQDLQFPTRLIRLILEYKYDYNSLIEDVVNRHKYHEHIDLVVAWCCSNMTNLHDVQLVSLLDDDRGKDRRQFYGSTHRVLRLGTSDPVYEVILLCDLLEYLRVQDNDNGNSPISDG